MNENTAIEKHHSHHHQSKYHEPIEHIEHRLEREHDAKTNKTIKTGDENFSPHLDTVEKVDSLLLKSAQISNEHGGKTRHKLPPMKFTPAHKINLGKTVNVLNKLDNVTLKPRGGVGGMESGWLAFNNYFKNDWSKESCNEFLNPLESFLDNQLKRERSSRRRCKELVKRRNIENNRSYVENTIKDLDEKISLNVLLKKNHNLYTKSNVSNINGGASNYRALIADEIIKRNSYCFRCEERNRRVEDNQMNDSMGLSRSRLKKRSVNKTPFKLPSLTSTSKSVLLRSSDFGLHSDNNDDLLMPMNSQLGVRTSVDLSNATPLSLPFEQVNEQSINNELLVNAEFNSNQSKTSVISKHPIEIKRKNFV
jgi:hypothetical protein